MTGTSLPERLDMDLLDLHDISLLLNYERGTTEPRFRHAKLREVVTDDFKTVLLPIPQWKQAKVPKTGFVFDKPKGYLSRAEKLEPDLVSNMLPVPIPPLLQNLNYKDLELYYWQARNHDGCYRTVTLFQHFIDLFPSESTSIRVRFVDHNKPKTFCCSASARFIIEMKLYEPKSLNVSCVLPHNSTYLTGADPVMDHAVLAFPPPPNQDEPEAILDLASLQFGEAGRGFNGKGIFVLEPVDQYMTRLNNYARRNDFKNAKLSIRINAAPDDEFLQEVARRAKERWDKRNTEKWCQHCGAPSRHGIPLKRCAKCRVAHYCDKDHQLAAWQYHKHFCVAAEE